jgi:hypothetical protein
MKEDHDFTQDDGCRRRHMACIMEYEAAHGPYRDDIAYAA